MRSRRRHQKSHFLRSEREILAELVESTESLMGICGTGTGPQIPIKLSVLSASFARISASASQNNTVLVTFSDF